MINFKKIKKYFIKFLIIVFSIFFLSKNLCAQENKIIFKINNNAFTSQDYEMRVKYLDFVGSNNDLEKNLILEDFISANLFFEYYKMNFNKDNSYEEKINEIFEDIKNINKQNNKVYKYEFDKKNILFNIKIDFIRKTILENILNSNVNDLNISNEDIDLLYNFKIIYFNFEINNKLNLKDIFKTYGNINPQLIKKILNENNVEFFQKEKNIDNIKKTSKIIKDNILSNKNFIIIENSKKYSIIFIQKKFETLDGLIANIYSVRSENKIDEEKLKCHNLINMSENENLISKNYKFIDLNEELKNKLININDYIEIQNNDEIIYIILCDIQFDKEILNNYNLNKLINSNINEIENRFINKYSKIYDLVINDA